MHALTKQRHAAGKSGVKQRVCVPKPIASRKCGCKGNMKYEMAAGRCKPKWDGHKALALGEGEGEGEA